ncbi:uncharacterized protein LOC108195486 isoform X2 [Daucus carota subsp. sativus]|uniref:uncharacterized protein LOC108195486 isoform X2 n=1 Tax=Daucus carota subsp. sativus TaxID=79200 RepID=UPI003082C2F2
MLEYSSSSNTQDRRFKLEDLRSENTQGQRFKLEEHSNSDNFQERMYHGNWKSETQAVVSLLAFLHWLETGTLPGHAEAEQKLGLGGRNRKCANAFARNGGKKFLRFTFVRNL